MCVGGLLELSVCTYGTVNIYFNPLLDAETYCKRLPTNGGVVQALLCTTGRDTSGYPFEFFSRIKSIDKY